VQLVHSERASSQPDAVRREQQIKGWSRAKKEALIARHLVELKVLSRCRSQHGTIIRE
jgi:predicted GIY-YIG superfamily endonuclease